MHSTLATSLVLGLAFTLQAQGLQIHPEGPSVWAPGRKVQAKAQAGIRPDLLPGPQPVAQRITVPTGRRNHLPQPQTPETQLGSGMAEADPITNFSARLITPGTLPKQRPTPGGSPHSAILQDTILAAGNEYAALSKDNGVSWSELDFNALTAPYVGGKEHRLLKPRTQDMMIWVQETYFDQNLGNNSITVAVARNRTSLQDGTFMTYDLGPARFGLPAGALFYLCSATTTDEHLYFSVNYHLGGAYQTAYVVRVKYQELLSGKPQIAISHTKIGGLPSPCFAHGGRGTVHWAAHASTTSMRFYQWSATGSPSSKLLTVPRWVAGLSVGNGGNGKNLLLNDDHRFLAGAVLKGHAYFAHGANRNGAARPTPYVRFVELDTTSMSYLATHDIYNSQRNMGYPSMTVSGSGALAGTIFYNSSTLTPKRGLFLADSSNRYQISPPFFRQIIGSYEDPDRTDWGFYQSITEHPGARDTFLASAQRMRMSAAGKVVDHAVVWCGRTSRTPGYVAAKVSSRPFDVKVEVLVRDLDGLAELQLPGQLRYAPLQGYSLRAPKLVFSGGKAYGFSHWVIGGQQQNPGDNLAQVNDIGHADDVLEAVYVEAAGITVNARNASQLIVGLKPESLGGHDKMMQGSTAYYPVGTMVELAAPGGTSTRTFRRWVLANQYQQEGLNPLRVKLDQAGVAVARAEYGKFSKASVGTVGTACVGSNGSPDHEMIGAPITGQTYGLSLGKAPSLGQGFLVIGASGSSWNGVPLPITIPGTNCPLNVSPDQLIPRQFTLLGEDRVQFPMPANVNMIGVTVFSQYGCLDPTVPGGLTTSNGLSHRVGGWDMR